MSHVKAEGGCLCGAIRYSVQGEMLGSGACHCRDCQYICGGAASNVFVVGGESLQITQGEPASYRNTADSGAARIRHFCAKCGTPLFAENARFPNIVTIKIGTLDDTSLIRPMAHFWTKSAPSWHFIDPEMPAFEEGAEGARSQGARSQPKT